MPVTKIDRRLNLVIPLVNADDKRKIIGYAHSMPVSSTIWEQFWEPISLTFTRIMGGGHGALGGPRIADKMLKKVSTELGIWEGPEGVAQGLVAEAQRLTSIMLPSESGWQMHSFYDAKARNLIDKDDQSEIEAALIFFTLFSLMHRRSNRKVMLDIGMNLWGAQIVSLGSTEFMNSLSILSETENSGETAAA